MAELIVDFPDTHARAHRPSLSSSVSFVDQATVLFVEDLSQNYKDELWFSRREMDAFRHRIGPLIIDILTSDTTMAQYADRMIHDTSSFMGLEMYLSPSSAGLIQGRRRNVRRAVLSEQRRQRRDGVLDQDEMRRVAEAITGVSAMRAHTIGMLHADGKRNDRGVESEESNV